MLTPDFKNLLDLFKGDFASLTVFSFLCTICEPHSYVSLRKIENITGFGRRRLVKILNRLEKRGYIYFQTTDIGTHIIIIAPKIITFNVKLASNDPAHLARLEDQEEKRALFGGLPKYLRYGLPAFDF